MSANVVSSQSQTNRYPLLLERLKSQLEPEQIITDSTRRLAYGTDASFYRLIPELILRLDTLEQVIFTIKQCRELVIPYTFRAAGTSLSGQAISDSVLITLSDKWRSHQILDQGERIRLQPGVIGSDANQYLAPFQRKIGPDPASINACKIGGIAANNASGMCCGTAQNSYQTIDNMKIVFYDGTLLDTASSDSIEQFYQSHPALIAQLSTLVNQTQANSELSQLIKHKYRLKNTTGYALNALVDYHDPIDVIKHLMIGSEGTLGFIAEVTYRTVIEHSHKASCLIVFANIEQASQAVTALAKTEIAAIEMMDGRAMRSVADKAGMPDFIAELDLEAAALLMECRATEHEALVTQCEHVMALLNQDQMLHSIPFTSDAKTVETLWGIRKGMFPAVGAVREVGTTVIIEDVSFPIEQLAQGVRDLQTLFDKYHYSEAIIFGHALAGNLHFVFTQAFDDEKEITRYGAFMQDVAELVAVKYQGSLKAEHGTGRNMAPFIELEWGEEGYRLMQAIKALFDPERLLNPGVIINDDQSAHLKNLKPMPAADPLVNRCIECGFCEAVCPSRGLTLTPRQRIVLYRELQKRRRDNDIEGAKSLEKEFDYLGIETCAATGLCAQRCPVEINTGALIKQLRTAKYRRYTSIARWTSEHFSTTTKLVNASLKANQITTSLIGTKAVGAITSSMRRVSLDTIPKWIPELPTANRFPLKQEVQAMHQEGKKRVVYMPSCASRNMGQQQDNPDQRPITQVVLSVLNKAGYDVILPAALNDTCCGMPYDSKGMTEIATQKAQQLEAILWQASEQGRYPVLMDMSPCAKRSIELFHMPLEIYEQVGFITRYLLPYLTIEQKEETIMLHITCSTQHLGLAKEMRQIAEQCVSHVVIPEHITCCAWAGDKGFVTPELNAAAVATLREQVPADCHRGFSNSRTCEIGLSHHSGIPYQSLFYLLDEVAKPRF
ncbi:FAD-binding and (Fe-S)-binding domain-containing protein [Vibrio tritonius]|uniref:FAD-binding and (Fe-S)-binding domain-containing protein n=1 Tax=Vibrio tritonius TaxID=1435069 RepID=UPI0008399FA6|nr:FAD-binding and (Fe-S)-binding domain-containing protein [Vibrio tritonius]